MLNVKSQIQNCEEHNCLFESYAFVSFSPNPSTHIFSCRKKKRLKGCISICSLNSKETKPVNPKGNKPWIFIGRTDAEAEAAILWPPDAKSWLIGKDLDAEKDWRWEEKGMTEDEMVGWHHQLNGHEFEQTLGVGDRQGNLVCCSP